MDLNRSIVYRGFDFNSLVETGPSSHDGCTVERVDMGEVEVVGYTEKRALDDGQDASDVFLGRLALTLVGTVFGESRGALYDRLRAMSYAVNPRNAKDESPTDRGYLPLTFFEPTSDVAEWDDGVIPLQLRVRATSGAKVGIARFAVGGTDSDPVSVPYSVSFAAKDPHVYARDRIESYIQGAGGDIVLRNRGGSPVPLNMVLSADANATNDREFTFNGGGTIFTVQFPKGTDGLVVRLDGERKYITLAANEVELLRFDLRSIAEWPIVQPDDNNVTWTFKKDDGTDATMKNTSLLFYRENFS